MPAPTTVAEFVELVCKSGVVDERRIDAYLERVRAANSLPATPGELAGLFVRDGLLTLFQAKQIVEHGKWRRFTIGKYKVLEQLGQGGMGSVYLCEHMLMKRRVAVKVLPSAKAEEPAALDRFYREARAVAALDHPNIVRAYDIDHAEKLHFLVMEYVDGSNLQEMVKRSGPMTQIRAAHYIRQAALGLQHAHEQARLVHRDIKPGNILVDRNGIVKILDMGLARFFHDEEDDLTKKHDENVLGTADYLAPEQALDSHSVDIRADIYSLGATFYFCLVGRTPFAEGTVAQKLIWHQTRQPKPIKTLRPDVEEGIAAVLDKMMAKDPGQRYQTPQEIVDALSPWTKTFIPPPTEEEMPKLSPAAMGFSVSSSSDSGTLQGSRSGSGAATPAPRPGWQVSTPGEVVAKSPSTIRSATPPVKPASRVPSSPPPAPQPPPPPAPPSVQQSAPVPRSAVPSMLQATPVVPRPAPQTVKTAPSPSVDESPAWEQFASDTDDPTAQLDTAPASSRKRARMAQSQEAQRTRRRLYYIMGVVGLLATAVIAFIVWQSMYREERAPIPKPEQKKREPMTFYVGPNSEYPSIASLQKLLESNDRIIVQTDVLIEKVRLEPHSKISNIRIESDPARKTPVIWKMPEGKDLKTTPILSLESIEGLTIKGFTFDGENKRDNLIQLICGCKDVHLEDIKLQNYLETGIRFTNCDASSGKAVELNGVQSTSNISPLLFEVKSMFPSFPKNDNIVVRGTCKFPAGTKIKLHFLNNIKDNAGVELPAGMGRQDLPPVKLPAPPK